MGALDPILDMECLTVSTLSQTGVLFNKKIGTFISDVNNNREMAALCRQLREGPAVHCEFVVSMPSGQPYGMQTVFGNRAGIIGVVAIMGASCVHKCAACGNPLPFAELALPHTPERYDI